MADRAEELAQWRSYCLCTTNRQHDPRCDGTRCVGQERAIAAALARKDAKIERLKKALREIEENVSQACGYCRSAHDFDAVKVARAARDDPATPDQPPSPNPQL
jgi:hypothetical protein